MEQAELNQTWLAIVNPNAGVKKCEKDWPKISAALQKNNIPFHAEFTSHRGHAIDLTKEFIEKGYRKVISVGGDGTLNEVVNGIFRQKVARTSQITLGVISVGTGNDWVRTFHIPLDYDKSAALLKKEDTLIQDAGMVSFAGTEGNQSRYFINMAGIGFDGLVTQKTNADKELGRANPMVYLKNIFLSLFAFKSVTTRIVIDQAEMTHKIFSMGIGIGQYNGGGMKQAPNAIPNDGLFDLTLIKDMTKWSVIANVNRLYNGSIGKHKQVELHKGRHIIVEPRSTVLMEADGESLGYSPFTFTLIPESLKVIINQENLFSSPTL